MTVRIVEGAHPQLAGVVTVDGVRLVVELDTQRAEPLMLGRYVVDRIHSAAIHLLRRAASADSGMNLDGPGASLLSILTFAGPQTMSRLAEIERVTPAAVTKLVTALEGQGLAVRVRDQRDRRVVRVEATPRGKQLLRRGRAARVRAVSGLLNGLSKEEEVAVVGRAAAILESVLTRTG